MVGEVFVGGIKARHTITYAMVGGIVLTHAIVNKSGHTPQPVMTQSGRPSAPTGSSLHRVGADSSCVGMTGRWVCGWWGQYGKGSVPSLYNR
jgi:hypothetical protein